MSDTPSTRSKSVVTGSANSESTDDHLIPDRWSHNITYRQLVVSTCISIVQMWWNPYLYDLTRLVPFIFLYNVYSLLIGYPLFYLELALGVVTKKGVVDCWDISPMARGIALSMIGTSLLTALVLSKVAAWCLALFVHSFHSFLPWLHCAAIANPPCAARHRPLMEGSETPPQSFFFNFVLNLKRESDGSLGSIVGELTLYYSIAWLMIYFIACKRIYSYSKLVLFKDVMALFVSLCCVIGASRLKGAGIMFTQCDWKLILVEPQMSIDAIEFALFQMSVCQGSLIMLGTYCPKQRHTLSRTALLAFAASKVTSMASAFVLGAAHGALQKDYDNATNIWPGASASLVLWSDFVARIPGSQFWSALIFFTMFLLAVCSTGLLIQTVMSSWTGHSIRKIRWAILITICVVLCILGIFLCTQRDLYALNLLTHWPVTKPRLPVGALIAFLVTYVYGQTRFCEDLYFAVGEYPSAFVRVCWAILPIILTGTFAGSLSVGIATWPSESLTGSIMVMMDLAPIVIVVVIFICFKFRVRNLLTEK